MAERIRSIGDFFTPLASLAEPPKKDQIECLIMVAALVESTKTTLNKYLPFCRHTDGFSEQIWANSWRLLQADLPLVFPNLLTWI